MKHRYANPVSWVIAAAISFALVLTIGAPAVAEAEDIGEVRVDVNGKWMDGLTRKFSDASELFNYANSINSSYNDVDASVVINVFCDWSVNKRLEIGTASKPSCNWAINLNGHVIDRGLALKDSDWDGANAGQIFVIKNSKITLTINGGDSTTEHRGTLSNQIGKDKEGKDQYAFWKYDGKGDTVINGGLLTGGACTSSSDVNGAGAIVVKGAQLILNDVTIAGNIADTYWFFGTWGGAGGAIRLEGEGAGLTLNNSNIKYNHAEAEGGGIYVDSSSAKVTIDNGSCVSNNLACANGGGIYVNKSDCELKVDHASKIDNNKADDSEGGGIYLDGTTSLTIDENCSVSSNISGKDGGGIYVNASDSSVKIDNDARVDSNTSESGSGGGIYANKTSKITMSGESSVSKNSALGSEGNGGGICYNAKNGSIEISGGAALSSNTAKNYGGGIYDEYNGTKITVKGTATGGFASRIASNTAGKYGGGLWLEDVATVELSDGARITDNDATNGGGIFVNDNDTTITLTDGTNGPSSIDSNKATSGNGGGVYFTDTDETLTLKNGSSINNNTATDGAGIYVYHDDTTPTVTINLVGGGKICKNEATGNGGAVGCYRKASVDICSSDKTGVISENTASGKGGGLWANVASKSKHYVKLDGVTVEGNVATEGGGVYASPYSANPDSTLRIVNTTITANSASGQAGGIYSSFSPYIGGTVKVQGNFCKKKIDKDLCNLVLANTQWLHNYGDSPVSTDSVIRISGENLSEDKRQVTDDSFVEAVGGDYPNVLIADQPSYYVMSRDSSGKNVLFLDKTNTTYTVQIYTDETKDPVNETTVPVNSNAHLASGDYKRVFTFGENNDKEKITLEPISWKVVYPSGKTETVDISDKLAKVLVSEDGTKAYAQYQPFATGASLQIMDWEESIKNFENEEYTLSSSWSGGNYKTHPLSVTFTGTDGKKYKQTGMTTITRSVSRMVGHPLNQVKVVYKVILKKEAATNMGLALSKKLLTDNQVDVLYTNADVRSAAVKQEKSASVKVLSDGGIQATVTYLLNYPTSERNARICIETYKGGGSLDGEVYVDVPENGTDRTITAPDYEGYEFKCWKTDYEGELPNTDGDKELPEHTVDGNKITLADGSLSGIYRVKAIYSAKVDKIKIKDTSLTPGLNFPSTFALLGTVATDISFSSTEKNLTNLQTVKWFDAETGDEVSGRVQENKTYIGEITTPIVSSWAPCYLISDATGAGVAANKKSTNQSFEILSSEGQALVDGAEQQTVVASEDGQTATIKFKVKTAKVSNAFNKASAFSDINLVTASDYRKQLASTVDYTLAKETKKRTADVVWTTEDEQGKDYAERTSGSFAVKGTFVDLHGDSHEVKQTFNLVDLPAPTASSASGTYGGSVTVTLTADKIYRTHVGSDKQSDVAIYYYLTAGLDGKAPESLDDYVEYTDGDALTIDGDATLVTCAKVGNRATATRVYTYDISKDSDEIEISFDSAGGAPIDSLTISSGSVINPLPLTAREGYRFMGWYDNKTMVTTDTVFTSSKTLTAKWEAKTFDVFFYDGDQLLEAANVQYGAEVTCPSDPTKQGYAFSGWYTDEDCTQGYDFSTPATSSVKLYAKWTIEVYDVEFEECGGSEVPDQSVAYGSIAVQPEVPVRAGYEFEGWYCGSTRETRYDFSTPVTESIVLYARWTKVATLSFDSLGGTPVDSITRKTGSAVGALPVSMREGYTFMGWYDADGNAVTAATVVKDDVKLVAKWSPKSLTVSFYSDGMLFDTKKATYDGTVEKPTDPQKTGASFIGWFTDAACTTVFDFSTPLTGNLTLYAGWTADSCTVTFVDGADSLLTATVDYGSCVAKPSGLGGDDYLVKGWYADKAMTVDFNFGQAITADTTIYVKRAKLITVTFDANGGSEVGQKSVEAGAALGELPVTMLEGSALDGWYLGDTKVNAGSSFDTDVELVARWVPDSMSVLFVDGNVLYDTAAVSYGESVNRPTDPKKTGYEFVGWYSDAELTVPFDFATKITKDTLVYAKWKARSFDVVFMNGTDVLSSQKVDYASTVDEPADPTMDGFAFKGWYVNEALTVEFDFSRPITGDTKVYAKWVKLITVSFDADGGSAVDSLSVEVGSAVGALPVPVRSGYIFSGWYDNEALVTSYSVFEKDVELKAHWEKTSATDGFVVTFMDGNGCLETARTGADGKVSRPKNPVKEGYTFDGWYAEAALTVSFDFDTPVAGDTVVYSKWIAKTCGVTFDSNGGSEVDDQEVAYGSCAVRPADPEREGYVFKGWYTDEDLLESFSFATPVTGDIELHAKWARAYTVTFNSRGGSEVASQTVEEGTLLESLPASVREGYVFNGWWLNNRKVASIEVNADVELRAHWERTKRLVTFMDGDGYLDMTLVDFGKTVRQPDDPVRDGYTFKGWYADESLTQEYDFSTPVTGDTRIYSKWEKDIEPEPEPTPEPEPEPTPEPDDSDTSDDSGKSDDGGNSNGGTSATTVTTTTAVTTETKKAKEDVLAATGDDTLLYVAGFVAAGIVIVGIGIVLLRRRR